MEPPITFERLSLGARHFAHLALNAHAQEETEVFLLEAGVSIERLAKATLMHANPALLVELSNRQDEALLHLAGVAEMPKKFHTVGAQGAIRRLRRMKVLPESGELDTLIELRNGVAHLGTSDPEDYLAPFVETICLLLDCRFRSELSVSDGLTCSFGRLSRRFVSGFVPPICQIPVAWEATGSGAGRPDLVVGPGRLTRGCVDSGVWPFCSCAGRRRLQSGGSATRLGGDS